MRRVSAVRFILSSAMLAVVGAASFYASTGNPGVAAAQDKTEMPAPAGVAHVQLAPFMAPVLQEGRRQAFREPVTLVLKVPAAAKPRVCTLSPRVYDAVLRELHREPISADRQKHLLVKNAEGRLAGPVSKALEGTQVEHVYILPGAHPKNIAQEVARRLPMTEIGHCGPVDAT